MNGNQNELKNALEDLCEEMYDGDKKEMLLDLLVVIGHWSEYERDKLHFNPSFYLRSIK